MEEQHVAYAMSNSEAVQSLVWFNNPLQLTHWTQPWLELIVIGGALCALYHAVRIWREQGRLANLYTWIACVFYGVFIEIITYNTVDNFWHGEFSVMLYHNRLPLYILFLYPALMYHAAMAAKALALIELRWGALVEALGAGFVIQMLYTAFDNIGPRLHWWIWDLPNETLHPFWYSVPSTSYFWILATGVSFTLIARWLLWEWGPSRGLGHAGMLGLAAGVGILTNFLMIVLHMPATVLARGFGLYFQAGALIAVCMMAAAWVYLLAPKRYPVMPELLLVVFPLLWCSFFIMLYAYYFSDVYTTGIDGKTGDGMPIANFVLVAITLAFAIRVSILFWFKGNLLQGRRVS